MGVGAGPALIQSSSKLHRSSLKQKKVPKPELNMAGLTSLPGTERVWPPITSTFSPNPEVRVRLSPLGRPKILPFPSPYQHLEQVQ